MEDDYSIRTEKIGLNNAEIYHLLRREKVVNSPEDLHKLTLKDIIYFEGVTLQIAEDFLKWIKEVW